MIEREANASSARAMTPEVVAARIVLCFAGLRLLAAWTSAHRSGAASRNPGVAPPQ
jgi:hypothetical protein